MERDVPREMMMDDEKTTSMEGKTDFSRILDRCGCHPFSVIKASQSDVTSSKSKNSIRENDEKAT
jgi:hypothetical protein